MSGTSLGEMPLHGGQVQQVMRAFPDAPTPFVDLSTGISPYAYPFASPEISALSRLPEVSEEQALLRAAATAYGVWCPEMVVAAPGTQMLIGLLPLILDYRRVTIWGPTYSGHETAWRLAGAEVQVVVSEAEFEAATRVERMVCIICNPNNPDGRTLSLSKLLQLAENSSRSAGYLIVDEAFADFEEQSAPSLLPHPALMVLRSFGKSYGLPGVRLGFLLTNSGLADRVRKIMGSWAVGKQAIEAGCQALADGKWLAERRIQLRRDRARLAKLMEKAGLNVAGTGPLFLLVRSSEAHALWKWLCVRGIVTRAFPERPSDLRFGFPANESAWGRLEHALFDWKARSE